MTTLLSHVEEVSKAPLPDQAQLDTLRSNVAKQQQKVDQLSTPQPSANGTEVPFPPCVFPATHWLGVAGPAYVEHHNGGTARLQMVHVLQCPNVDLPGGMVFVAVALIIV